MINRQALDPDADDDFAITVAYLAEKHKLYKLRNPLN